MTQTITVDPSLKNKDPITKRMHDQLMKELTDTETILNVARGVGEEALVATDKRVYTLNKVKYEEVTHIHVERFEFDEILDVKLSRFNRVGRCQILTPEPSKYVPAKDARDRFALDHSTDLVNFPYAQFASFNIARKLIMVLTGKVNPQYMFD